MPRYKMIGGAGDGEEISFNDDRQYWQFPVGMRPSTYEPYVENALEITHQVYTVRRMRFRGGDKDVAFLAPDTWNDDRAIRHLIESHRSPRR